MEHKCPSEVFISLYVLQFTCSRNRIKKIEGIYCYCFVCRFPFAIQCLIDHSRITNAIIDFDTIWFRSDSMSSKRIEALRALESRKFERLSKTNQFCNFFYNNPSSLKKMLLRLYNENVTAEKNFNFYFVYPLWHQCTRRGKH